MSSIDTLKEFKNSSLRERWEMAYVLGAVEVKTYTVNDGLYLMAAKGPMPNLEELHLRGIVLEWEIIKGSRKKYYHIGGREEVWHHALVIVRNNERDLLF